MIRSSLLDPTSVALKDWLHAFVFDHASGSIGLLNTSVHGPPDDPRSRAVGTALFHLPEEGWTGSLEIRNLAMARIEPSAIALSNVAVAVNPTGTVLASARFPEEAMEVRMMGTPSSPAIVVVHRVPLGPGWVSWSVVPRLSVTGRATIGDRTLDLDGAVGYQDRNWGRWHWGDDLGWQFGAFAGGEGEPTFVFVRLSDRAHRRFGRPRFMVEAGAWRRSFSGGAVDVELKGALEVPLRRLPGALAALHPDRTLPDLPKWVRIRANDGRDVVEIEFEGRAATQIIAADPIRPGYGFIHEIAGRFRARGRTSRGAPSAEGLAVVEFVA